LKLAATASTTVRKVVTTGALGAEGSKVSEFTVRGWTAPATDEELKDSLSVPFYEPSLASEAYARRRGSFADPEYRSYYDAMFEGDKQQYLEQLVIPARELSLVECEAMLVHGRHDKIAGYEQSLLISQLIRKADVAILGQCGHAVAAERPKFLMDIIRSFCA
jgi:2-hydroxymuconate-semialdehyde hydrolase